MARTTPAQPSMLNVVPGSTMQAWCPDARRNAHRSRLSTRSSAIRRSRLRSRNTRSRVGGGRKRRPWSEMNLRRLRRWHMRVVRMI